MTKNTNPVPEGFHTVTPYMTVPGVPKLIDFLKQAFDVQELQRNLRPDGTVQHAEVRIGDSIVMMGEPEPPQKSMPAMILLYVADPDTLYQRALKAGATSLREPADQPYGDRMGGVEDSTGNQWWVAASRQGRLNRGAHHQRGPRNPHFFRSADGRHVSSATRKPAHHA